MKIYKITKWDNKQIEVFEIEKKTEKTVWVKKNFRDGSSRIDMERTSTDYYKYFDTFEDAKKYLIKKINDSIERLKNNIIEFNTELEIVSKLKEK